MEPLRADEKMPRVLVVDDDMTTAMLLQKLLMREGFRTTWAMGGVEGRAAAEEGRPDLILLDINMPDEDGFEVCRKLKANPMTATIPVIFVSTLEDVRTKVQGFDMGAVDYITKPYERAEITARVRLHIRMHRAQQSLIESHISKLQQLSEAQRSIMVRSEELPDANFSVVYRPLHEAGGDFYDVIRVGDGIYDYLAADVSGHDLGTSLATAALKAVFRQLSGTLYTPLEILRMVNEVMRSVLPEGHFVTAAYARLNRLRNLLTVVSAGHPPVILTNQKGETELVEQAGDVLGVFDAVVLESREFRVNRGDRFYLYTDGLIEIPEQNRVNRRKGIEELCRYCHEARTDVLDASLEKIVGRVFLDERKPVDDVVFLGVEV